jgi:hypothetical protein
VPSDRSQLENGTEEGSKADAGSRTVGHFGGRRGELFVNLCFERTTNHCPSEASWVRPPGQTRLNTDFLSLRGPVISMESLILAQDERWRRA